MDDTTLAAALGDPAGFVRGLDRAIIDEVQRAPDLLRAIKRSVDDDRRPGRFLLTGSANLLALPAVSESLAGRMAIVNLLALSPAEVRGERPAFLERALAGEVRPPEDVAVGDTLVGIEVKASATVRAGDLRGLRKLQSALEENLRLGVVLYDGDRLVPFGDRAIGRGFAGVDRLFAAPVSCLWGG